MSHGETPFPSSGLVMDAPMTITYFNFWGQPQKTDQGFGSRLRPTEDACLCSWSIYKLLENIAVTYRSIKRLNCYVFLKKIKNAK